MSLIKTLISSYEFNRGRTLGLLAQIEEQSDPGAALGFRPGVGRAHIAWQLMHVGVTEEIFATERLLPDKAGSFTELWPRFRGGSTPDDDIPSVAQIRQVLNDGREHLLDTIAKLDEGRLDSHKITIRDRTITARDALFIISWHEAHHQGQAHITFNLFRASKA